MVPDNAPTSLEDADLREAWQLLMGLVLDQRWRWSEVAEKVGVSQAGLRAILAIDPDDARPMRDLAAAMNCDASYATGIVDDLERVGVAERRPAPMDRRVKTVALTPRGRQVLCTVQDELFAPPPQLATLTRDQQATLARLLRLAIGA